MWHRVNFFDHKADIVEKYAQIGDLIYIEGEINNREIEKNGVHIIDHSIIGHYPTFIPNTNRDKILKTEDNHGSAIPFPEEDEEIPY